MICFLVGSLLGPAKQRLVSSEHPGEHTLPIQLDNDNPLQVSGSQNIAGCLIKVK